MLLQWILSKLNFMGIDFCVQNRQEFGLYRLNQQRFTALGLFYLYFGLNTRFHFIKGSDRFEKSFQEILEQWVFSKQLNLLHIQIPLLHFHGFIFSESIKTICESYMQENMAEIVRLPSFSSLPHDIMVELIQKMTEKMNIR